MKSRNLLYTALTFLLLLVLACGGGERADSGRSPALDSSDTSTTSTSHSSQPHSSPTLKTSGNPGSSGSRYSEMLQPVPPGEIDYQPTASEAVTSTPERGDLPEIIVRDTVPQFADGAEFVAEQIIATFKPGVSQPRIIDILQQHDLWAVHDLGGAATAGTVLLLATGEHPGADGLNNRLGDHRSSLGSPGTLTASSSDASNLRNRMDALLSEPEVANVSPNAVLEPHLVPNDPHYENNSLPRGDSKTWLDPFVTQPAWDRTTGSSDITIAILDTGVSFSHPDLSAKIDESRSDDFWTDRDPEAGGDETCFFHGTGAAGTAAAIGNNDTGLASPDWNSTLVSLRVAEGQTCRLRVSNSISALNHIASANNNGDPSDDIEAASMSYGTSQYSSAEDSAANSAYNSGALLFASAGNGGADGIGDSTDQFPSYPAGYDSVMQISSVDPELNIEGYSNYGTDTELSGQGERLPSGANNVFSTFYNYTNGNDGYTYFGGTSAASPNAAGVATLGWSMDTSLDSEEMRQLIKDTGFNLDQRNPSRYSGLIGRAPNADWLTRTLNYSSENNPACEPNGGIATACVRTLETTYQDWVRQGEDGTDYFSYTLQSGDYFVGNVLNVNRGAQVEVDLFDSSGTLLDEGDTVDGNEKQVEYDASSATTVYMRVQETSDNSAPYDYVGWEVSPELNSVDPAAAKVGDFVTLTGSEFGPDSSSGRAVEFSDGQGGWVAAGSYNSWSSDEIEAKVPSGAHSASDGVRVSNQFTSSEPIEFQVVPRITNVDDSKNYQRGDTLTIEGIGFGDSRNGSTVTFLNDQFGDVEVTDSSAYQTWQDDQIKVTIPDNAHSGPVQVTKTGLNAGETHTSGESDEITILLPSPDLQTGDQF